MFKTRPARKSQFGFESLESRRLMAGEVKVVVDGGDLVITGDSKGNTIEGRSLGLDRFEVKGVSTTVNGQSGARVFRGEIPDDVVVEGGSGNDTLTVDGVVASDIRITTGSGKDVVNLKSSTVLDDVSIENNFHNSGDSDAVYL